MSGRLRPAPCRRYGAHPDQVANLHLPHGDGPFPVVVLVHGGFWRAGWDRTLMTPLAHDLAARGFAAWNVEYRRVGQEGGGWPGTFDDLAAAVDALAEVDEADGGRVVAVGHSAGGHLALWLASREDARVPVGAAVALGAVCDLGAAHAAELGDGAVADLLGGGPGEVPERYAAADPAARLPLRGRAVLVHGGLDEIVPLAQSERFAAASGAELVPLPDADHFDVIDAAHPAWAEVVGRLPALLG